MYSFQISPVAEPACMDCYRLVGCKLIVVVVVGCKPVVVVDCTLVVVGCMLAVVVVGHIQVVDQLFVGEE